MNDAVEYILQLYYEGGQEGDLESMCVDMAAAHGYNADDLYDAVLTALGR